jgi:hypothetical protein
MKYALEVVNRKLFADSDLTAIVGTNIHYARAPVTTDWPQIIYFAVSDNVDYLIDYQKTVIQISMWSTEKYQALELFRIIKSIFREFRGIVSTHYGDVDVNWTEFVDASSLPQDDNQLFGHQLRFELRTRGENIGGL